EVTGSFSINSYVLTYKVDGADYKKDTLVYDAAITPLAALTKEGYTFSGWSDIPANMPASDVEVTGSFSINKYILTYKVDGADYKKDTLAYNAAITPLAALTKEGYTFSGWSDIPATMPASDVEVIGSFMVNKYLLTVLIDGIVVYSDSIAYGVRLADYADLIKEKGIDITQWEWYSQIETITMPAHDVVINAVLNSVRPIRVNQDEDFIYDLSGKKMETDDISTLPAGMYIRNGRKFIVR
ncbi:MAG: InlB B-repeat-containing protein, partial [Bacteroidaceae bacterium]|nr:InlB B-repeat-containing protein [Bacteroidaceae bacterium]